MSPRDQARAALRAIVAIAALLLTASLACTTLPTGPSAASVPPVRGITLVDWTADGYGTRTAEIGVLTMATTGANTVVIVVTAYQADRASSRVRSGDPRTPTPAAVRRIIGVAKAQGFRVALKPHVDVDDGTWRGHIAPSDPAAWFESYRAFLVPWAALAETLGVDQLAVGTELAGTSPEEGQWRRTIDAVRTVFRGEILYAASWDEAGRVPFWDAVDLVGVDFYFPVEERSDAGRLEILAAWQPWLDRLERLHRQTGREILLSEIGYRSVDGAGMAPHDSERSAALDTGEQADLYWAALEATAKLPWIRGLYWWNWPADGSGGPLDVGFTPRGKPAAHELAVRWGGS